MLRVSGITKSFPGVKALSDVSIEFKAGETHALLGENGAGKSTLIKIITGVYQADQGQLSLDGKPYQAHNPIEAFEKGINVVHQDLQVVPMASVAENLLLDKMPVRGKTGLVDWDKMNKTAAQYLEEVGLNIPPDTKMDALSIGQRQLVLIAKALATRNIKVLLLDEPTASITSAEAERLFTIIDRLKKNGVLIIFVSHVLEEVLQIADRISILRDGKCMITDDAANLDRVKIVKHMIGREENTKPFGSLNIENNNKVLEVKNVTRQGKVYDASFELHKGEILGFYGLVGAGRTELAKVIIGEDRLDQGEIYVNGQKALINSVSDALAKYKMGYVTEDRRNEGLINNDEVKTNITVTVWDKILNKLGFVPDNEEEEIARKQVKDLAIKTPSLKEHVAKLSGGNQQKVSIAKWLAANNEILIFDEPTVGVDIGAKEFIHKLIYDLANEKHKSIILISSDMPEIIKLANRILVMSKQRIVGEVDNSDYNYQKTSTEIGELISEYKVAADI